MTDLWHSYLLSMPKRLFAFLAATLAVIYLASPGPALAAGISPSGGGTFTAGTNFTITVNASGVAFTALEGLIQVTGPVSIVGFAPGPATWLPGMSPANGKKFAGAVTQTSSLRVATITLRGTSIGSGRVTVSGVQLARSGSVVGTSGGTTNFTITRAPTPPGQVTISSATHPDQDQSYEATTVELSWQPPANGASGYSHVLDQAAETVPPETVTTTETSATFENLAIGTYYFHIRPHNADGWGPVARFKLNVKPSVDESLPTPTVTSVAVTDDYSNDVEEGTLTGIIIQGTGPADFKMNLTFTPGIDLPQYIEIEEPEAVEGEEAVPPKAEPAEPVLKYPAPLVDAEGNWTFTIIDPVKAGFYRLVAQAQQEGVVSPASGPIAFEVTVAEGGKVRVVTASDQTEAYQQAQIAAAQARQKSLLFSFGGVGGLLIIALLAWVILRRRFAVKAP
jgi:hypothetical protein